MKVRVEPAALGDIEAARRWYTEQDPTLGHRFEAAVDEAIRAIADGPELCALVHRNARRKRLRTFPYGLYYVYLPEDHQVVVVACTHARASAGALETTPRMKPRRPPRPALGHRVSGRGS